MNTNKCIRCGSENNEDYKFCVNCGAVLPEPNKAEVLENSFKDEGFDEATARELEFDGVTSTEMTAYVKNNTGKILPKFYTMEKFGQKVSFCFPVFFLGLIFGFLGISIWCFYRKMKKLGVISLCLGIFLFLGNIFLNLNTISQFLGGYAGLMGDILSNQGDFSAPFLQTAFENLITEFDSSYIRVFSFLNQYVGGFICPVLMGMFALHFYKTKAVKDIKDIKGFCPEEMLLSQLSNKGGTSKALAAIPVIVHLLTVTAVFALFVIYFLLVI